MLFKKNRILVYMLATIFVISSLPMFGSVASPEKVRVIIGFHEKANLGLIKEFQGEIKNELTQINAIVASVPTNALKGLKNNPHIKYVEEDKYIQFVKAQTLSWGVDRIDANEVWSYNTGAGIAIAILDTGIDYNHPDLVENYLKGESFVDYTNNPMDDHGHGTHCAGIAAADSNGIGVVGVAPDAQLIAVKVLDNYGSGYLSWLANGINWAANNGADVISMSVGSTYNSQVVKDACDYAYYTTGCVVVAAAGNSGNPPGRGDNVEYPARYASVIAVSATGDNDKRAKWSSTGPDVEMAAPGVDIYSTLCDDSYGYGSGTSMACPHVSGVSALVLAGPVDPSYDSDGDGFWDSDEVRSKMCDTAEDLGDPGRDTHYGYGLVDAEAATSVPLAHDVAVTAFNAPSSVFQGDTATIQVTVKNLGTNSETFDLAVTDETYGDFTETRPITLSAGASSVETFTWYTTGATLGVHTIKAEATLSGDENPSNNAMTTDIEVKAPGSEVLVSTITPSSVKAGLSIEDVTITGSGFAAGASVTFENGAGPAPTASSINVVDSNTITATVTAKSGGPPKNRIWDVRVTNQDGNSGVLTGGFTVIP